MVTLGHSVMQILVLCWELLVSNPCSLGSLAPPLPCKLASSQVLRVGLRMAWGEVGHRSVCYAAVPCALTASGELLHHQPSCLRSEEDGRRKAAGLRQPRPCLPIGRARVSPKHPQRSHLGGPGRRWVRSPQPAPPSAVFAVAPSQVPGRTAVARGGPGPRKQEAAASRARLQGCPWSAREFWKGTWGSASGAMGAGSGLQSGLSWFPAPS